MATRPFRTEASFAAEARARSQIVPFLRSRGFQISADGDIRTAHGSATSQTIKAVGPAGTHYTMKVRLCWRRDGRNQREECYSAAQLRARLLNGNWTETVQSVAERGQEEGVDSLLFVQPEREGFSLAAIVPNSSLLAIWEAQRQVSANLIQTGQMGRITKNHAENGQSPTIWLQDERMPLAHKVADVLWAWPGVVNIMAFDEVGASVLPDDTFDDLPIASTDFGRDFGITVQTTRSGWKRDPRVRAEVIARADGQCERADCENGRNYVGFLDVHHILGAGKSDRLWTCVALCPNCHRDAHFSPDKGTINNALLDYAARFAMR